MENKLPVPTINDFSGLFKMPVPPPPPSPIQNTLQQRFSQLLGLFKKIKESRNRSSSYILPVDERKKYQRAMGKDVPIKFTGAWNDLVNQAQQVADEYKIPPAVMVGQMALETGRGTSNFAQNRNNYFGMGAFDSNPNNAYSYKTPQDSMRDYANLLTTSPRYSSALQYSNDPYRFLQEVKNAGYATDPNYVDKVSSTPEFRQLAGG